ncbi:hypothetical protein MASR1M45_07870 [Candidatus Kapaibacterium sp.]
MNGLSRINVKTKNKLALLIFFVALAVIFAAYLLYKNESNKLFQSRVEILHSISTLKSNQLSEWFLDEN